MPNKHASWMLENGMVCTATQILHLKPWNPGARQRELANWTMPTAYNNLGSNVCQVVEQTCPPCPSVRCLPKQVMAKESIKSPAKINISQNHKPQISYLMDGEYRGVIRKEDDLCKIVKKTSGKKENFDEQRQSKLQHCCTSYQSHQISSFCAFLQV